MIKEKRKKKVTYFLVECRNDETKKEKVTYFFLMT